jgi:mono/diheme cytochrome c family protein
MTAEIRLSHVKDELSHIRALPIAVRSTGIRDQAFGETGRASQVETSAGENRSRQWPIAFRRGRLLFVFLPALCWWVGVASGQGMGSEKRWEAPALQAEKQNPVPVNESSLAAGEKIYAKRCVACHGQKGNGDGPDAVDLGIHPAKLSDSSTREETDGALFWKITVGKKPMPDYGRRLSPTDRWNVINYLRTLARR